MNPFWAVPGRGVISEVVFVRNCVGFFLFVVFVWFFVFVSLFARRCVFNSNITPDGNVNSLFHRPFFFISCEGRHSKSAILRHMATQKLTQYVRGIWVHGWVGHHLACLWVLFLSRALAHTPSTSFTEHNPQSNGPGDGKYPRHAQHF